MKMLFDFFPSTVGLLTSYPEDYFWIFLMPEIALSLGLFFMIFISFFQKKTTQTSLLLVLIVFIVTGFCVLSVYELSLQMNQALWGHFGINRFNTVVKILMLGASFLIFFYNQNKDHASEARWSEYVYFFMLILIGSFIAVSAANIVALYLGIEIAALSIYSMIAMCQKNPLSTETALKYFLLGAVISALMLFGISLMYGASLSLNIYEMALRIDADSVSWQKHSLYMTGMVLFLVGLFFKIGAAPTHVWMPDVYTGSSVEVLQVIGSVSKIAAFGILITVAPTLLFLNANDQKIIEYMLYIFIVTSLLWGNLAALMQTNIKKLLAYSAIGHVGFILLSLKTVYYFGTQRITLHEIELVFNNISFDIQEGLLISFFYIAVYTITAVIFLGTLTALDSKTNFAISDLDGMGKKHPWTATILSVLTLSMLGLPPTLGFYAKFLVFLGLIQSGQFLLLGIALLASVLSVFYYLKIIKALWFKEPKEDVKMSFSTFHFIASLLLALFVLIGFFTIKNLFLI